MLPQHAETFDVLLYEIQARFRDYQIFIRERIGNQVPQFTPIDLHLMLKP